MANRGFVWYESYSQTLDKIKDPDLKLKVYDAIVYYGIYRELPEDTDDIVDVITTQIRTNIDYSNNRYDKAIEDGKKGGRKKKAKDEDVWALADTGMIYDDIAEKLNISKSTVQRAMNRRAVISLGFVPEDEGDEELEISSENSSEFSGKKKFAVPGSERAEGPDFKF